MLQVVLFIDGRYGIQNSFTGILLKKNGKLRSYKTQKKARRVMFRIEKKTYRALNKYK